MDRKKDIEVLPPFYVGQEVVAVDAMQGSSFKNGHDYVVSAVEYKFGNPSHPVGRVTMKKPQQPGPKTNPTDQPTHREPRRTPHPSQSRAGSMEQEGGAGAPAPQGRSGGRGKDC